MQKWLPLNYSFVFIQNIFTNLAPDIKIFKRMLYVIWNVVSEDNLIKI